MSQISQFEQFRRELRYSARAVGERQFPTTAAAWATAFPSITAPTAVWGMQESAAPLADGIASADLDTEIVTPLYAQSDGDPLARLSFLTDAANEGITCTANTELDATGDFSVWIRAKIPSGASGTRAIVGKRGGAGSPGWYLGYFSSGNPFFLVDNGPSAPFCQVATNYSDDIYHDFLCTRDDGATNWLYVDGTTPDDVGDAGGSITNTGIYTIGSISGTAGSDSGLGVSYMAFWDGTIISSEEWTLLRGG